jgi:PKD repeat protein
MSQNQQHFEDLIKQALENFEVEFNPSHWREMDSRLNLLTQGVAVSMNSFYSAFVIAGLFMAGLIYFGIPQEGGQGIAQNDEVIEVDSDANEGAGHESVRGDNFADEISTKNTFVMEVPSHTMENLKEDGATAADDLASARDASGAIALEGTESSGAGKVEIVEYGEMKIKRIKSSVSQGCEGMPITFSSAGSDTEGNYLWNFGDGYFSNNHSPVHVFDAPGIFDVSLLVTPLTGGKLTPLTVEDQIKINPKPRASFEYTYKQNELNIPQVKFENRSKNSSQVIWKIGDDVISDSGTPIHNFTKKGTYDVKLIAINEFGCSDTIAKTVVIKEDYNLMAAEEFQPGADGRGETFMPKALRLIDGNFVMRITDTRTDMVIFETNDFNTPWDGSIHGTTVRASSGEYQWEVDVEFENGTSDQFTGQVRLKK